MTKKLMAVVATACLFATPSLANDSFDYSQHNYSVKLGNAKVTYRDHADLDKWMTQVDYKFAGYGYAYRYQESKGKVEHRLRLNTPSIVKLGNFKVTPRIELRDFEAKNKDDFGNLWLRAQYSQKIGKAKAYIKIQPKLAFGRNGYDDGEFYTAQNLIGVDYKLGAYSVGVFVEQNTDADWNTKSEYLGTNISYKF
jgi:hypothetical protein